MKDEVLYEDKLVIINSVSITLKNYYFPSHSSITVNYDDITRITVKQPTMTTGKYRYWGTGDFIHWYPMDNNRSRRDLIFFIYRKNKKIIIGFTVENSQKVKEIFTAKGFLK